MVNHTNDERVIRVTLEDEIWITDDIMLVVDYLRLSWEEQGEEKITLEYTWISREAFDELPDFEGY